MPLQHRHASTFSLVNGAEQLWRSNLLPALAVLRREEVATDTTIILVDHNGMMVGSMKAHSLVLAAVSTFFSKLLASNWSIGTEHSVIVGGRNLVEGEELLEGVYRGEELHVSRLRSWIKGEEEPLPFEEKADAFKSLELEILGDILGKEENIATKRDEETQGKVLGTANQIIQPPNEGNLLCPVFGCDFAFSSRNDMRHHLKTDHSKRNENSGIVKTNDNTLQFKVKQLEDMFLPVKNHEEIVKKAENHSHSNRVKLSTKENLLCPEFGCTSAFPQRQGLRAHIRNVHHKSLQAEQQCPIEDCEVVLKSAEELEDHIKSLHWNISQSKVQRLKCPYPECSNDFVSRPTLMKHLKLEHTSDKIECRLCDTFYKDVYYLKKHNARKHSRRDLQCDQCEYRTSMMEDLRKHMDSKHDPSRYTCEFCGKDFSTGRGLDVHMIQKHGKEHKGQELMCSQCDYKVIGQPSKLEVHVEMKHNSVRFTCLHCDFVSVGSQELDAHMSGKHESEQMKENKVAKSSEQRRREREATKEYPCNDCEQVFRKRGGLRNHRITQHLKSSFPCPEEGCEFKTKHKALVKHHQEIKHMGLFKQCDMCNFMGRTKTRLDSHKINKHKVTPIVFSCNKCETKHSSRDKMRKHMLSMH